MDPGVEATKVSNNELGTNKQHLFLRFVPMDPVGPKEHTPIPKEHTHNDQRHTPMTKGTHPQLSTQTRPKLNPN
jgi:hypothetical protein